MPLGTEVGLGQGDNVLDGDPRTKIQDGGGRNLGKSKNHHISAAV